MIAKIVKGAGAKGIVDYILDREKKASLIDHDGVLVSDNGSIARSFIGHVSLSFSGQDLPRLTDELMVRISREYMMKMGIRDTQYIIGRHHDKEQVNTDRLKEPDRTRYELYFLLKTEVGRCGDWDTLIANLWKQGVEVRFKHKGRPDGAQGEVFGKNGYSFNGSKIDRQFSYSKIAAALNRNSPQERQAQSFRQGISPASGGGGELISGSLGLLDLIPSSCTETPEEAEFRRLMQRKKKKKNNKGFRI